MDLRDYQTAVALSPSLNVMERVKLLATMLRFITREALAAGFSLEELASLDEDEG